MSQSGQMQEEKQNQNEQNEMAATMSPDAIQAMMNNMFLRDMCNFAQISAEIIEQINAQLWYSEYIRDIVKKKAIM